MFSSVADVTASRVLGTTYTNGSGRRRWCFVSVVCTAAVGGQAQAGWASVVNGQAVTMPAIAGFALGLVVGGRFLLVIPVDPGGTYSVTTSIGAGGAVSLQQWLEVDS